MDLDRFCRELQIAPADRSKLELVWEPLTENWTGGLPFYINADYFAHHYPLCKGPFPLDDLKTPAAEVIRICRENEAAALFAHVCYRGAFLLDPIFELKFLPDELPFFGKEYSGMFSLMVSLGVYPLMVKAYAECGVPESYAKDTFAWIGGRMLEYGFGHDGRPGRDFAFDWIRKYVDKKLFRIGRLEYLMHPYREYLPLIFRNDSGTPAVLCPEGWQFRADGQRIDKGDPVVFTSHVAETGNSITGTPIPPDGKIDFSATLTLDTREWKPAISPWQLCPSIHIPAGSRMPWEEVKSSLLAAREFFARYFHRQVPLFSCCSWILNPAWEELFANSNMARFRQECYAVPGASWGPRAGMKSLFGRDDVPPDTLPAVNSAQRAMQKAYRAHRLNSGVIFVFAEDIEKLGDRYYRKTQFPFSKMKDE